VSRAVERRIEDISREALEERLRAIARDHHPEEILGRMELVHLVQVVTSEALALTDLYARVSLGEILERRTPTLPPALCALAERSSLDGEPRLLFEVRQLPDRVKAVGDKCLFDLGLSGQSDYQGIPLGELGPRSYQVASQILARLAEDPLLERYFRDNRLRNLPIEEEVIFLQQCSRRFALYADLLRWLRDDRPVAPALGDRDHGREGDAGAGADRDIPSGGEERLADRGEASPPVRAAGAPSEASPQDAAGASAERDDDPGGALVSRFPSSRPAPLGERLLLSRDELLAAYERILLFSSLDLAALRDRLAQTVVAQEQAIQALCDEFSLYAAGTHNLNRPPSYLFVGPTGVGKNHLVETLIGLLEEAWRLEIPFLTLEGPSYTYPSDINELRGATRGFIRSDEEGILTEFHQRASTSPLSVILVDEIEKAHPQLRRFFLSIMDRGTVTDNKGQVLHFANSMLIYTSNIGYSDLPRRAAPIGYADQEAQDRRAEQEVRRELRRALSPEFVNRLRLVHFGYLDAEAIDRIFDLELTRIERRFEEVHGLGLVVTPAARQEILGRGYSHDHGARHLRARMESLINVEVSRKIKTDERGRRPGARRMLRYLRELKDGRRPFDLDEVRARVLRQARARVPYRRVVVDFRGGEFSYEGIGD
jgi:MoxR-like ATPase